MLVRGALMGLWARLLLPAAFAGPLGSGRRQQRTLLLLGGSRAMNALDFSPLFRTAIGFDRLARMLETARTAPDAQSYPPYNIEKTGEDSYVLTMAVAGFGPSDIEVVV